MINCIKAHLHVHTDIFCVGVYKSMLDKTLLHLHPEYQRLHPVSWS